jgi:hypothetical protein
MKSKFPSTCPMCLRPIVVGHDVDKLAERWVHSVCMPAEPDAWEPPENWKWRGRRTVAGGRSLTRSKAAHGRPYRWQ